MKKIYSIFATVRTWKDERGNEHKARFECGAIFQSSSGALVVKIEALPCTKDFAGWLSTVPCVALPDGRRVPRGMPPAPPPIDPNEPNPDEDIPF